MIIGIVVMVACLLTVAFGVGRFTAPKTVTVQRPWPAKDRCPEILRGRACVQCRYKAGHKGVHRAHWRGRDWPFDSGDELTRME